MSEAPLNKCAGNRKQTLNSTPTHTPPPLQLRLHSASTSRQANGVHQAAAATLLQPRALLAQQQQPAPGQQQLQDRPAWMRDPITTGPQGYHLRVAKQKQIADQIKRDSALRIIQIQSPAPVPAPELPAAVAVEEEDVVDMLDSDQELVSQQRVAAVGLHRCLHATYARYLLHRLAFG